MKNYDDFLKSKVEIAPKTGINIKVDLLEFNDGTKLKPHQRDSINWALEGGKRALFESFGLGKTIQQLIICNEIIKEKGGKALIVAPLGVQQEFKQDAKNKLGIEVNYIKSDEERQNAPDESILITNYERVRDGNIDPTYFTVTSLDEASVLRGYGTKTYQTFLQLFKGVEFKFVATATPSPNKYKELIHYAGYLEIMDTGLALTRFFQRDSTKANNLTLYPHKEKEFWLWMSTWALFLTKPSDLGYDDTGYDLPEMELIYHELKVDHSTAGQDQDGQVKMFRDAALGLKEASKEKRDTLPLRINKMREILTNDPDSNYIVWHDLESERHEVNKVLKDLTDKTGFDVYGSQNLDTREQRTLDFANGKMQYIATKPTISGSGCNFQRHCHKAIFLGVGYKFNDFIQAIHRIYRFLQNEHVEIHIIYAESENEIMKVLMQKWKQHKELVKQMTDIIKENGLAIGNVEKNMLRAMGIECIDYKTDLVHAANNDCVLESRKIESNSIGLIHTSIPFSNHYEYTPSYNDFGHNENNDRFFDQMDYLTPELHRILQPGRLAVIHVKDRILFGNATGDGMPTVDPFSEMTVFHFLKHGFRYMGRITIETDVVRENNQTYRLGWTEQCKDGSKMGIGCPEYLLLFRKLPTDTTRAYADIPVTKTKDEYTRGQWQIDARAKWNSSGDRFITKEEIEALPIDKINRYFNNGMSERFYNYKDHVELAKDLDSIGKLPATFETLRIPQRTESVWDDINRMNTFNTNQSRKNLTMHICPLQFDIVERVINRYSNKEDIIFDPFGGLQTVPYVALKMGRKGRSSELNAGYFKDGIRYLREIEQEIKSPTLFDFLL